MLYKVLARLSIFDLENLFLFLFWFVLQFIINDEIAHQNDLFVFFWKLIFGKSMIDSSVSKDEWQYTN